ncbi:MAG: hypothetical protein KJ726_08360, partial [Verrucomicrobia bacterium]|nr:hypothetical protein [Verrucomicrobiota bacterium]
ILLLVTGNMLRRGPEFFAPFVVSVAVVLAFGLWSHILWMVHPSGARRPVGLGLVALAAWGVEIVPAWFLLPERANGAALIVTAIVVLIASWLDDRWLGPAPSFEGDRSWPAPRILITAAAGVAILLAQRFGLMTPWPYPH